MDAAAAMGRPRVVELRQMSDEALLAALAGAPLLPPDLSVDDLCHLLARDGLEAAARATGWTPAQLQRAVLALAFAARRVAAVERKRAPVIASGEDLYELVTPHLRGFRQERVVAVFCDRGKRVLSTEVVAYGDEGRCPFPAARIVTRALELDARYVAVAHNHPSGDPSPSREDLEVTRSLRDVLRSEGVILLDHVIVTERDFTSLRLEGHLD
ncbi:MAG TPA: JAB domain-containing protein [Limnochordales bacterium]